MEPHVAHPDAYALEMQHRPLQNPLEQELLEEHVPPSDVLLLLLPFLYTQLPELDVL